MPSYDLELELKNKGYKFIIGIDEAGRGPLMGPVVAGGVCIPDGLDTTEINDSKKLSEKKRERLHDFIKQHCWWAVSYVHEDVIDRINIREATKLAMRNVIYEMCEKYPIDYALVDGNFVPEAIPIDADPVIGGDTLSVSIAAASIIAKVSRDVVVLGYHNVIGVYNWDKNKGYGTKAHRDAIKLYGPSVYHRKSFRGVL